MGALDPYYQLCFGADLRSLKRVSKQLPLRLHKKIADRFMGQSMGSIRTQDPFLRAVVLAYRSYYKHSLLKPSVRPAAELHLKKQLIDLLHLPKQISFEKIEAQLMKKLAASGFGCRAGRVAPLRNIFVWRYEKTKDFSVKTPLSKRRVRVRFLDEFVEAGWMHFATFGRYYAAGWAEKRELFCVSRAFPKKRRDFESSFLIHEAQHFDDYIRFPSLKPRELEYRAKLCELESHPSPTRLLRKFALSARNDKNNPHSWAAHQIITRLGAWRSTGELRLRARELFDLVTKRLTPASE